jgi:hypothetical protein
MFFTWTNSKMMSASLDNLFIMSKKVDILPELPELQSLLWLIHGYN